MFGRARRPPAIADDDTAGHRIGHYGVLLGTHAGPVPISHTSQTPAQPLTPGSAPPPVSAGPTYDTQWTDLAEPPQSRTRVPQRMKATSLRDAPLGHMPRPTAPKVRTVSAPPVVEAPAALPAQQRLAAAGISRRHVGNQLPIELLMGVAPSTQ